MSRILNTDSSYVLGIDFGTDSVRTILVDAMNGHELAASVFYYPRWRKQQYCDAANFQFRQHPLDYVEGLTETVRACVQEVGPEVSSRIRAISVDTTGSTPVATDMEGTPLALLPEFSENPNAMFVLWKDHTSVGEAAEINAHAQKFDTNYLQFVGGIYSSEWFWAKLLHIMRSDERVASKMHSFVEHCDWIPFLLTGGKQVSEMKRSVCAAGHKILWADEWGGLPPESFFSALDPRFAGIRERMFFQAFAADQPAGVISEEWAGKLGVPANTVIGVGAYDAHMGAVGGQVEPYHLSKVMGTSTCDIMVVPSGEMDNKLIKGICGQVPGSVIPGMIGLEAGQSAFGDAYAWFKRLLSWPLREIVLHDPDISAPVLETLLKRVEDAMIPALSDAASRLDWTEDSELAVDWFNGRRTPDANQSLKASIQGLDLGSDAPGIFRAIVEATCFGARAIVERFEEQGIPVKGLIGLGGVARKSPFVMQMMADVINMPIRIHRSEQTCALGAAMFAATAGGIYDRVEDAMQAMGQGFDYNYDPNPAMVALYEKRYRRYKAAGEFIQSGLLG